MTREPVLRPGEVFVFSESQYKFGVGPVVVRAIWGIEAVEFDGVLWWELSAEVANGTTDNHGGWIVRGLYVEAAAVSTARRRVAGPDSSWTT